MTRKSGSGLKTSVAVLWEEDSDCVHRLSCWRRPAENAGEMDGPAEGPITLIGALEDDGVDVGGGGGGGGGG
eukprot:CAMPEP_0194281630 /NCGR_PEP_ID=MMETSP0169-20130528/21151_1 /TAXON_ID=218684 /ORGANISM="Corethron pennatum, Strain L29A3" /LENGTH=71 /DNA_ID=CAMNT_0039026739 /DNA_START=452 /DNA_END=662 /DNA_ORIENTATION=-